MCVYVLYIAAFNLHRWIARTRLFSSVHYIRSHIDWANEETWDTGSKRVHRLNDSMRIGFFLQYSFRNFFVLLLADGNVFFLSFVRTLHFDYSNRVCLFAFLCVSKYLLCDCCLRRSLLFFSLCPSLPLFLFSLHITLELENCSFYLNMQ